MVTAAALHTVCGVTIPQSSGFRRQTIDALLTLIWTASIESKLQLAALEDAAELAHDVSDKHTTAVLCTASIQIAFELIQLLFAVATFKLFTATIYPAAVGLWDFCRSLCIAMKLWQILYTVATLLYKQQQQQQPLLSSLGWKPIQVQDIYTPQEHYTNLQCLQLAAACAFRFAETSSGIVVGGAPLQHTTSMQLFPSCRAAAAAGTWRWVVSGKVFFQGSFDDKGMPHYGTFYTPAGDMWLKNTAVEYDVAANTVRTVLGTLYRANGTQPVFEFWFSR